MLSIDASVRKVAMKFERTAAFPASGVTPCISSK